VGCQITENPRHTDKRDNKTTDNLQKICLITKNYRIYRYEIIILELLACRGNGSTEVKSTEFQKDYLKESWKSISSCYTVPMELEIRFPLTSASKSLTRYSNHPWATP